MTGIKHDNRKPRFSLLPWRAVIEVIKVMEWAIDKEARGEKAYPEGNWKEIENAERRYADAASRHLADIHMGKVFDDESKLLHWAHLSCCALMGCWHALQEKVNVGVPRRTD